MSNILALNQLIISLDIGISLLLDPSVNPPWAPRPPQKKHLSERVVMFEYDNPVYKAQMIKRLTNLQALKIAGW
jgi:hypothetical protein